MRALVTRQIKGEKFRFFLLFPRVNRKFISDCAEDKSDGAGAASAEIQKNYAGRGDYYAHLDDETKEWESLGTESASETFRLSYENGNRCARSVRDSIPSRAHFLRSFLPASAARSLGYCFSFSSSSILISSVAFRRATADGAGRGKCSNKH